MNQSALIGGSLLAGFALFLASRDRLSAYGRILWGDKPAAHSGGETAGSADEGKGGGFDIMDPFGEWGYSLPEILTDLGEAL